MELARPSGKVVYMSYLTPHGNFDNEEIIKQLSRNHQQLYLVADTVKVGQSGYSFNTLRGAVTKKNEKIPK